MSTVQLLEADPVVLRRVHPAEVVLPDGRVLTRALAVVTRERVYVWAEGTPDPVLVFASDYDPDASTLTRDTELRRTPMALVLAGDAHASTAGAVLLVNKGRGCGCTGSLKRWQPFTAPRSAAS